ncbi:phosphopyruvate hydratase, partial [Candidatus Woesebacteria bacterium]|nr:phosphopyruvate hydratase [Candidatus Woesebacteria bacterium]
MARISRVWSREIIDSRATPTVETVVQLDTGHVAVSSVSSSTMNSTGKYKAVDLRDEDEKRFFGYGVLKAVSNVNQILGPKIVGADPTKQAEIDQILISLDGSPNKVKLGANAILSVSQAVLKA